jgi:serine/threonine-protein kinase
MKFSALQWQRIQELFEGTEGLTPEEALAHLHRAEADSEVREEVLALLRAASAEQRLRRSLDVAPVPPARLEFCGPYRITGVIGAGGFGTVFKGISFAGGVERPIAIKVLREAFQDQESFHRFDRERQMLGALDDPRIARLLDAGSTGEGAPYLAMEYVEGVCLPEYCDREKLSVADRVRLIAEVADAVQHAHRRLVVHLDLKPSNILVTAGGSVKLVDFGTAKLLAPTADATATQQITPAYAAPERLRGGPVSVECDIYSLGLVLYELVSGTWPFESRDSLVGMAERASGTTVPRLLATGVTEEAAARRSLTAPRLRAALRGDLEAICAKALAFRPEDRYASMEAFHADLDRFLEGRPVKARPQTALYRLSKYVVRHRRSVAVALVTLVACSGFAVYAWQQEQSRLQAGQEAETMASLLRWAISSSNTLYGGRAGMTVSELVERASARLDETPNVPDSVRARLQLSFSAYLSQEGQGEKAEQVANRASISAARSGDANSIIGASLQQATLASGRGDCKRAVEELKRADVAYAESGASLPALSRASYLLIRSEAKTYCENDLQGSRMLMAALPAVLAKIPDDDLTLGMPPRIFKAIVANHQAQDLRMQQKFDEAEALVESALASAAQEKEAGNARVALLRTLSAIRLERNRPGDVRAAAKAIEDAIAIAPGFTSAYELLRLKTMLAAMLARAGDPERAAAVARNAVAEARQREAELAGQGWMIYVSAAYALGVWAADCGEVGRILSQAAASVRGEMAPSWRWQFLAAEGACLVRSGLQAEGEARLSQAVEIGALKPGTPVRQRLEAIRRR